MNLTLWRYKLNLLNKINDLIIRCKLAWKAFNGENILFGVEIYPTPDGRVHFSFQTPLNLTYTVICGVDFIDRRIHKNIISTESLKGTEYEANK